MIEADKFEQWNTDVAAVLARADDPQLPRLLDAALLRLVPFDLSIIFAYPSGRAPLLLFDGLRGTVSDGPLNAYLGGAYLLDPFYIACTADTVPGLHRMQELAPDNFFNGEYYSSWEVHPCISMESGTLAEEIGYLFPIRPGVMAAYSLMRSNGRPSFDEDEFRLLGAVEPIVRQALTLHWRQLPASPGARGRPAGAAAEEEGNEGAFSSFMRDVLTPQQQRIVQLILRGHSNLSIGRQLGISEGTAKNHRQAIYQRLNISSQGELFQKFINHLSLARAQ